MIYSKIHTTSPCFRERNINNPRTSLHNGSAVAMSSICIRYIEILVKRNIKPTLIIRFCTDLRPFLEFIENIHQITTIDNLRLEHVENYAAMVRSRYRMGDMTFNDALEANGLLNVVSMFCLQLFIERLLPEDYSQIPLVQFPQSNEENVCNGKD
jgi:hypothetical protein